MMSLHHRAFLVVILPVLASACAPTEDTSSSSSGSGGATSQGQLGAQCASSADCGGSGLVCQTALPGGYCTRACTADADCGSDGVCVEGYPTVATCLRRCDAVGQCREGEGYACNIVRPATLACVPGLVVTSSSAPDSSGTSSSSSGGTASSETTMGSSAAPDSSSQALPSSSPGESSSSPGASSSSPPPSSSSPTSSSSPASSMGGMSSSMGGGGTARSGVCAAAQVLPLGQQVSGTTGTTGPGVVEGCQGLWVIGKDAPENIWVLTLNQAAGVTIRLNASWDSAVYVLGGPGRTCLDAPVLRDDACRDSGISGQEEVLTLNWLEAGTYWVVVDGFSGGSPLGGPYTLRADAVPGGQCVADPSMMAPANNNTAGAADPLLSFAPTVEAVCASDEDWYRFAMTAQQGDATVTLTPASGTPGSLVVDFYTLTGTAPSVTATPYTSGVTRQGNSYRLAAPPAGTYGVRVRGMGLSTPGISYAIRLQRTCEPDAYEPDNDGPLVFNSKGDQRFRSAQTACVGDIDTMMVSAPTNGPATITLRNGAALDVTVQGYSFVQTGDVQVPNPPGVTVMTTGADKVIQWNALAGRSLYITVALPAGATEMVRYTVVTQFTTATHDVCSGATTITPAPVGETLYIPFTTVNRTNDLTTSDFLCSLGGDANGRDVFFTINTGGQMPALLMTIALPAGSSSTSGSDHLLYLLNGGCGAAEAGCDFDQLQTNPLPGASYTLVVDSFTAAGYEALLSVRRTQ